MDSLEERVWQRVLGQPTAEQGRTDIKPMILAALELAAVYQRLVKEFSGRQRELLKKLYEGEMANIACLKGISAVSGMELGKLKLLPGQKEPARRALEKCYHRTRRAATEYTARSAENEFGVVFLRMAERERELCAMVVELLGGLQT